MRECEDENKVALPHWPAYYRILQVEYQDVTTTQSAKQIVQKPSGTKTQWYQVWYHPRLSLSKVFHTRTPHAKKQGGAFGEPQRTCYTCEKYVLILWHDLVARNNREREIENYTL